MRCARARHLLMESFFFFQAEDGIRDYKVTGVQTCALPISRLGAAYNNLGSLYLKLHEYRKAAAVLERGLKIDPAMSSASALLGLSLYEMGEYASARPRLEAALRANPKDNNAELLLANALIKMGELEAATVHLQQLAHREPKDQEVWYLLGEFHV